MNCVTDVFAYIEKTLLLLSLHYAEVSAKCEYYVRDLLSLLTH